jgi:BlaR1 peptidase M56
LLSSLVIGLSLPLISYQIKEVVKIPANVTYEETTTSMPLVINSSTNPISNTPIEEPFDWNVVLQGIYGLGMLIMLIKLINSFRLIGKEIIHKSSNPNGATLRNPNSDSFYISTQSKYANSSFFNLIFIDDSNLSESEINQILEHEKWHIRLYHTYDLLFVEILKIIFWFNPILWLYQRSLSEVHEYEVDTRMIQAYNPQSYAQLLLKLATTNPQLATSHQFSRKPLTDRIHFLFTKQKSVPMKRLAYLSVLPILGAFFMAFSVEKVVDYQEVEESSKYFKIVRGEKMNIKSNDMSKLALMGLKKDEITFFIGFDRLSKESIEDARRYFKDYGFTLDIVNFKLDKSGKLANIELSLLEDDIKNKQIGRVKSYDMYNDGGRFDLEEFKKISKEDKGFCLLINANKKTGHHSVALADIALTPPPPPKPPLPPVKVGLLKKNESDKVGEVMINNERFFTSIDKKGLTTIYNRFGVQVNEEGKALTLKDIPKVGFTNAIKIRNINATGLIVDSETLLPLNNAELYDDNNQLLGKTNAEGFFNIEFDVNKEGEIRFRLVIKKDGYAKFVQKEHWGDLQDNLGANYYFGLGKKWTNAKSFSELTFDKKYTTYNEIRNRFSLVKEELDFEKKVENAKKNNSLLVHKIDNDYYLINDSGWIKLNSEDDKIIVNGDKIFSANEINSQIKRSRVRGMSPILSKNASFEIQVSRF